MADENPNPPAGGDEEGSAGEDDTGSDTPAEYVSKSVAVTVASVLNEVNRRIDVFAVLTDSKGSGESLTVHTGDFSPTSNQYVCEVWMTARFYDRRLKWCEEMRALLVDSTQTAAQKKPVALAIFKKIARYDHYETNHYEEILESALMEKTMVATEVQFSKREPENLLHQR